MWEASRLILGCAINIYEIVATVFENMLQDLHCYNFANEGTSTPILTPSGHKKLSSSDSYVTGTYPLGGLIATRYIGIPSRSPKCCD